MKSLFRLIFSTLFFILFSCHLFIFDALIEFLLQISDFGFPYSEICSAAGLGFEPRLTASKAAVLPLDDPANRLWNLNYGFFRIPISSI